jgi:hypothetical protein
MFRVVVPPETCRAVSNKIKCVKVHLFLYILEYCNRSNCTQNIFLICTTTNMRIALSSKTPLLVYNWLPPFRR